MKLVLWKTPTLLFINILITGLMKGLSFFVWLLSWTLGWTQPVIAGIPAPQSATDSLQNALRSVKADSSKVSLLNQLAWEMRTYKPDTSIVLSSMALSIAEKISYSSQPSLFLTGLKGIAQSYKQLGVFYSTKGLYETALQYDYKALPLINKLHDLQGQATLLNNMGINYWKKGDHVKALDLYFKSLKMNEALGNKKGAAGNFGNIGALYANKGDYFLALEYDFKAVKLGEEVGIIGSVALNLCNIGTVYTMMSNYPKAIDYEFRALKIQEELNDRIGLAHTLSNIGVVFQEQGNWTKALSYYQAALDIENELGNKTEIAHILGNMASLYADHQKKYSKALDYQLKALQIAEEVNDKQEMCDYLSNMGNILEGQGDSIRQNGNSTLAIDAKYPQAASSYLKALDLAKQLDNKRSISVNLGNMGLLKTKLGNYEDALSYLSTALQLADSIGEPSLQEKFHKGLSELYAQKGQDKKALEHYKKYSVLKDSLYTLEKDKEITRKEMNHEFDRKEQLLRTEQEKKELLHDKEKQKYRIILYFGISITLLISILGFMFYKSKIRKMQTNNLQAELRFLKNQINPHFLFNILNSIYVLTQTDAEKASNLILKLSNIIRYQLYECTTDLVPLQGEINFITDYLEIQKIRSSHKLKLHFTQRGNAEELFIAPMVLMVFIENAFKFGVEPAISEATIRIDLVLEPSTIKFRIENSIPADPGKIVKGGIGLQNVQRRLDLLYPGKYQLIKNSDPAIFLAELTIHTQ
jgi:tetratricopeptide (TPR) repeat protein